MKKNNASYVLKHQWQLFLMIMFLLPLSSYGQGQERAVGTFIEMVLFLLFSITCLSAYLCFSGTSRIAAFLISFLLSLIAIFIIITAGPPLGMEQNEGFQSLEQEESTVGYLLLIPNLVVIISAPILGVRNSIRNKRVEQ